MLSFVSVKKQLLISQLVLKELDCFLSSFIFCFYWLLNICTLSTFYRTEKEPPSTYLWTLFLVAQVCFSDDNFVYLLEWSILLASEFFYPFLWQHYDRRCQYSIALDKIDEAINHTPTVIDLYSAKVCVSFTQCQILWACY